MIRIKLEPEWTGRALDTLAIRCPLCGAKKGEKCQVAIRGYVRGEMQVVAHRTAKVPHNHRRAALWQRELRERRRQQQWRPRMIPAIASYGQAQKDEYQQMQQWLRTNYRIFGLRSVQ